MEKLTTRQREILDYIVRTLDEYQYPPSIREIGDEFGITNPNGVKCHLKALQKKDYIDWTPSQARSIVVHGRREKCPHCGKELVTHG